MTHLCRMGFIAGLMICTAPLAIADEAASCEAKYKDVAPIAIKMDFLEFDQSPSGWRQLANCPTEASLLLKRYAKKLDHEVLAVRWHLAQTLAAAGNYPEAIDLALLSLNSAEVEKASHFSWNTYVQATVAFLRNDRAAFDIQLEAHRAAAAAYPENKTNLDVLVRMGKCFGKPYMAAYTCSDVALSAP